MRSWKSLIKESDKAHVIYHQTRASFVPKLFLKLTLTIYQKLSRQGKAASL